jgi:hypothetical protein
MNVLASGRLCVNSPPDFWHYPLGEGTTYIIFFNGVFIHAHGTACRRSQRTRDLKVTIDAFDQEIQEAKDRIIGYVQNPLDAAVQKLLIPTAISVIRGLRSSKDQAAQP